MPSINSFLSLSVALSRLADNHWLSKGDRTGSQGMKISFLLLLLLLLRFFTDSVGLVLNAHKVL